MKEFKHELPSKDWLTKARKIHHDKYCYHEFRRKIKKGTIDDYSRVVDGSEAKREYIEERIVVAKCAKHGRFYVGEFEHIGIDIVTKCDKHTPVGCPICQEEALSKLFLFGEDVCIACKVQSIYTGTENFKLEFKKPDLPKNEEFIMSFDVEGTHAYIDESIRFIESTPLHVKPMQEKFNEFDKNAIAIIGFDCNSKKTKIGYIPAELAHFMGAESIFCRIRLALLRATIKRGKKSSLFWVCMVIGI